MRNWWVLLASVIALACGCGDKDNDQNNGADAAVCTSNTECAADQICAGGACVPAGSVGIGGRCSATRDCMAGLNCAEVGMCVMAGTGMAGATCESAADCAAGLACLHDGFGGTCAMGGSTDLGGTCTAASDCLAGLVCGSQNTCAPPLTAFPPFAGVTCAADTTAFGPYFEVPRGGAALADYYRLPFPNDIRVLANGQLDLSSFPRPGKSLLGVDVVDLYADALQEDFEGFSAVAPVTFRFTSELDFDSLGTSTSPGAHVHLVDVTQSTPQFGQGRSRGWSYSNGIGKYICQQALQIGTDRNFPMLPGHTYAAYVTTAIRGKNGAVPVVPPDMTAMLGATQPTDADLAAAWTKYAGFRAYLAQQTIDPATIAVASVFTVGDHSLRAQQIATAVGGTALPTLSDLTLCDGVNVSPCASDTERACGDSSGAYWEIHGKLSEPNYQAGTAPFATPADGGAITYSNNAPVAQGTTSVCFALTIPKTTAPGNGWPLIVHAHGTGGSFKAAVSGGATGIAGRLATASTPFATLTFDGVAHGARKAGSTRSTDSLVFNVINPRAARDNHLQGAVDVIQALRVAQVAPFTVGAVSIDFDATKTYFFGHSQGSNVGIPALGVSDEAAAALLSGAGSDLSIGILTKTTPVDAKAGLQLLLGEPLGAGHPVMVIWQTFFERIDPITFTPMLIARPPSGVASKHIMQTWSETDTYSPKDTMSLTARTAGLLQAEPVLKLFAMGYPTDARPIAANKTAGDGPTRFAAVFQYATDGTYDGHFVAQRHPQAIADWIAFFTSLANGTPNVP